MIFYPQHCYDCGCTYISEERHEKCRSCNSNNTINCFGEELKKDLELQKDPARRTDPAPGTGCRGDKSIITKKVMKGAKKCHF